MVGWVGDDLKGIDVVLYSDADFAGCKKTARSTTGVFLTLQGENTYFPFTAASKKQTCVSHSTPEAEVVAADHAVRAEGIPAIPIWELLLNHPVVIRFLEDNNATICNIKSGKFPKMRHVGRTHRVDLMWLHETFVGGHYDLMRCESAELGISGNMNRNIKAVYFIKTPVGQAALPA